MAEQNIKLPATPERTKSNSSNGGEKTVPHYLRASTGSCHDHCKYGGTHVFLTKTKRPIRRKVTPTADYDDDDIEIVVLVDKKAVVEKQKLSSYPETLEHEPAKIVKREKKATTVKVKPSSDSKTLSDESTKVIEREKKVTTKVNSPSESAKVIKSNVSSSSMKLGDSLKQVVSNTKDISLSAKVHNSSSPKVTTVKLVSSSSSSSLRGNNITNNGKDLKVLTKRATSLTPKSATSKSVTVTSSSSAAKASGSSSSVRRESDTKMGKNTGTSKVAVTKGLASPTASLSPHTSFSRVKSLNARKTKSLKIVSPVKNLSKVRRSEPKQQPSSEITPVSASLSPKTSFSRMTSLNARKTKSLKIVSPVKIPSKVRRSESKQQPSSEIIPEKTLHVIKMETENNTPVSVENKSPSESSLLFVKNSHPGETKTMVSDTNTIPKGFESLNSAENESPTVQSSPPSALLSIEYVETKSSEECKTLETDEIEMPAAPSPPSSSSLLSPGSSSGSLSQSLSSHEEDLDGSEYTDSDTEYSIIEDNKTETVEAEDKRKPRKARMLLSEDKDGNPVKLSFRRGKVVNLQSESNSPHKLRFRRGRVLGETQKGDAQKRTYKKREEIVSNSANFDSEKVVLRHQDVQGKKDLQGLFNNVIEQTASKLAETRRSKVKALVGAFETVISLQDKKSTTHTSS